MHLFRIIFICLLCVKIGFSQEDVKGIPIDKDSIIEQTISENDLESYRSDDNFNYNTTEAKENALDRFFQWLRNGLRKFFESLFGVKGAAGILLFIFRILPYLLLAFLVFLLLRFFLKVNSNRPIGKTQPKGSVLVSEEEQIIRNENINALISTAIANGDFRLAIRYYYLLALKHLTLKELIIWEPQKTNKDYLQELQTSRFKADFEKITRIYDYVWYGEFAIDDHRFNSLKNDFEALNSKLGTS